MPSLPLALVRALVRPQAKKRRVAQQAVRSPFAKPDLTDVDRVSPGRRARFGDLVALERFGADGDDRPEARRVAAHDSLEHVAQLRELRIVEPRACSPRVDECALDVVCELQCAKSRAVPLWLGEPDDHEIVGALGLDLEPLRRATAAVRGVRLLRDDPLEPERGHLFQKRLAFALDVIEVAHGAQLRDHLREQLLPSREGQGTHVEVLEREQVEHEERRRQLDRRALDVEGR